MVAMQKLLNTCVILFLLFSLNSLPANTLTVNSLSDAGTGSLRERVASANTGDTLVFGIEGVIRLDSFVVINKPLTILGPGFNRLILDGQDKTRLLSVLFPGSLYVSGIHFRAGDATQLTSRGGGAIISGSDLVIEDCLFENNRGEYGGAVHLFNGLQDTLTAMFRNCVFLRNETTILDGGGLNLDYAPSRLISCKIENCVFTENISAGTGGAINLFGPRDGGIDLLINSCTIARNQAKFAGGINNFIGDPIQLFNTILARNAGRSLHPNALGKLASRGFNLIDDTTGMKLPLQFTDQVTSDPGLGPLMEEGELIPSIGLLCNSPAVNQGAAATGLSVDVRKIDRDAMPDIGAHERSTFWDTRIDNKKDSAQGSVRLAIAYACPGDTLSLENLAGSIPIGEEISIDKSISIFGKSEPIGVRFEAKHLNRIFVVENGVEIRISYVSFWGGKPAEFGGGAILNKGITRIDHSTFAYNRAVSGGAVANYGDGDTARLFMTNCTLSQNEALFLDGGAIDNYSFDAPAMLELNHCTFAWNHAKKRGGAIASNAEARVKSRNALFALNDAEQGTNCFGSFLSQGNNLFTDTTEGGFSLLPSDLIASDPGIDSLGHYGGATYTHRLQAGSPAIDAGNGQNSPATDQRGNSRLFGMAVDIGSYEFDPSTSANFSMPDDHSIKVYPNPASSFFWVDYEPRQHNKLSLRVFNLNGQLVRESSPSGFPATIDVSTLTPGVYILLLQGESLRERVKISVE
jgi:hypothetical protein